MTARVNTVKRVPKNEINFKIKLNEEQKEAKRIIYDSKIVAVTGKAGSGKTLIGCEVALSMFFKRQINRIVITRPTVRLRGTEDLGMLPGEISEKLLPYTDPIVDNMNKLIGKEKIDIMLKKGEIIVKPLQFIRGITIDNEILLIDESQNVENQQLKAILTRIGKESKMIFTGDINQCDLNSEFNSGLLKLKKLSEQLTEINFVELKENHRDPIVEKILELW